MRLAVRVFVLVFAFMIGLAPVGVGASVYDRCFDAVNMAMNMLSGFEAALHIGLGANVGRYSISVDLAGHEDSLLCCFETIGIGNMSRIVVEIVDEAFFRKNGRAFLFSKDCMRYEIEEHANGYLLMNGLCSVKSKMVTWYRVYACLHGEPLASVDKRVLRSVRAADLDERDIFDKIQNGFFRYDRNLRQS